MKSSNAQILDDLQRYRRIAADVNAQSEKTVIDIFDAYRSKQVNREAQRRRDRIAPLELLVQRFEELNLQDKELLQKITEIETQKRFCYEAAVILFRRTDFFCPAVIFLDILYTS